MTDRQPLSAGSVVMSVRLGRRGRGKTPPGRGLQAKVVSARDWMLRMVERSEIHNITQIRAHNRRAAEPATGHEKTPHPVEGAGL